MSVANYTGHATDNIGSSSSSTAFKYKSAGTTVAPIDPMLGVYAAVTRRTLDGKNPNGWVPEQKISVEETLRAYTFGSAYAEFQEKVKGQISAGMLADIVMLDQDIFTIKPEDIDKTKVLLTIVDGRVVYERK